MLGSEKGEGSLELEENGRFGERLREFRVRGECRIRRMEFRVQEKMLGSEKDKESLEENVGIEEA